MAPIAKVRTLLVTQVRQALQQTATVGTFSLYFTVVWATRPVQICFTSGL